MNDKIVYVRAMEILDSHGNPTIRVFVALENGIVTLCICSFRRFHR